MSKVDPTEDELASVRAILGGARKPETLQERGAKERKARLRHDGRSNKVRQVSVPLRTDTTPEIKARLVAICRRDGIYMRDFIEAALLSAFAKHGGGE